VPTFGWETQESTSMKASIRLGLGLRVYLDRPWYSSGPNELLGVVVWPESAPSPDADVLEREKDFFTQWGADPIFASGDLDAVPRYPDLASPARVGTSLSVDGTAQAFDVAGYEVVYDADRRLWYSDITFQSTAAYTPFVRLALARYQPHSIEGVELSRVVLGDFAQIAPNRSAFVSVDPGNPRKARVVIGGLGPAGPQASQVTVSVEQRDPSIGSDLGWKPAPPSALTVTEDVPAPDQPNAVLWSGSLVFAKTPPPGAFRVVVREFEVIAADGAGTADPTTAQRLVYAAIIPYDFTPSPTK
jgi:hypothetical protein